MVGEVLRRKREELGKDLREISETLKIKYSYLKALEEDDLKNLPAEVYVKAYLLSYAKLLGLDPDSVLKTYSNSQPPEPVAKTINITVSDEKKRNSFKYFFIPISISLVAIIIAATIFKHKPISETKVIAKTENIQRKIPENINTGSEVLQSLEIKAIEPTWLQIVSDNTNSQEMLIQPGETFKCQAKSSFSLKIGNAGGIRVFFNGKDIGKLGESGQVIRLNLPENGT